MPEATKVCKYVELEWTREPDEDDPNLGEVDTLISYDPCGLPADHKLVLAIEGVEDFHDDYLCCKHRADTIDEIQRSEHCGVTVMADHILAKQVTCEVTYSMAEGCYVYRPVILTCNGKHYGGPASQLQATNMHDATAEAERHVAILREGIMQQSREDES